MGRPRTPTGTYGAIGHRTLPDGKYEARARYRDWDGTSRQIQAAGPSRAAAELELRRRLAQRSLFRPGFTGITQDSPFPALVDYWLEDMEIEDRLSRTTRLLYERNMRTLVLPAFKDLTLREIGVARCDHFISPALTPVQVVLIACHLIGGNAIFPELLAAQQRLLITDELLDAYPAFNAIPLELRVSL